MFVGRDVFSTHSTKAKSTEAKTKKNRNFKITERQNEFLKKVKWVVRKQSGCVINN